MFIFACSYIYKGQNLYESIVFFTVDIQITLLLFFNLKLKTYKLIRPQNLSFNFSYLRFSLSNINRHTTYRTIDSYLHKLFSNCIWLSINSDFTFFIRITCRWCYCFVDLLPYISKNLCRRKKTFHIRHHHN